MSPLKFSFGLKVMLPLAAITTVPLVTAMLLGAAGQLSTPLIETIARPPSGALSLASRFRLTEPSSVDLVLVVHGIDRIVLGRHLDADRGPCRYRRLRPWPRSQS